MTKAETTNERHIPTFQLLLYSSPTLAISMVMMPLAFVIPAYYDAHTAATLTMIGLISMASRFFDAFTDPMIGWLSDRTRSPIGKKKTLDHWWRLHHGDFAVSPVHARSQRR